MKPILLALLISLILINDIRGQSVSPFTVNTSGGSSKIPGNATRFPDFSFEWSIGESTLITTNSSSTVLVNHGVLQGYLLFTPEVPVSRKWFPEELKLYPNPVVSDLTVDLLTTEKGMATFTLFNSSGMLILQQSTNYLGLGQAQTLNLNSLPAGSYFLRVSIKQLPKVDSPVIKQGTFQVIKVR